MAKEFKNLVLIFLVVVSLALGLGVYLQKEQIERADTAMKELSFRHKTLAEAHNRALVRAEMDRKVLVSRQAEIAANRRQITQQKLALQNALSASQAWADTQVPHDVQKALQRPPDGLPVDPDSVGLPDNTDNPGASTPSD